jgi:hypothetical protein
MLPADLKALWRLAVGCGAAQKGALQKRGCEDYVEEAWRIVDPALKADSPVFEYDKGTWGSSEVGQEVSPEGGWHNPIAEGGSSASLNQ